PEGYNRGTAAPFTTPSWFGREVRTMSVATPGPVPPKAELETVVRWPLVAAAAGFAALLLGFPIGLACLGRTDPGDEVAAIRGAAPRRLAPAATAASPTSFTPRPVRPPAVVVLPPRDTPSARVIDRTRAERPSSFTPPPGVNTVVVRPPVRAVEPAPSPPPQEV